MTAVTATDRAGLAAALRTLKLSGMLATLDARLVQAAAAGGHASAGGRRVTADGELAGHPVHIFTPLADTP
jgi:hypothetical protein